MIIALLSLLVSIGNACEPIPVLRGAEQIIGLEMRAEREEALLLFERVQDGLACQVELLRYEEIWLLYQAGAVVALHDGQRHLAISTLAQGLRLVGLSEFDPRLSSRLAPLVPEAQAQLQRYGRGTVAVHSAIHLDGAPRQRGDLLEVSGGWHVVQSASRRSRVNTWTIDVSPEGKYDLGSPEDVGRAGPGAGALSPSRARMLMGGLVAVAGATGIIVGVNTWGAVGHDLGMGESESQVRMRAWEARTWLSVGVVGVAVGGALFGAGVSESGHGPR